MRITALVALLTTVTAASGPSAQADIAALLPTCNACHGVDGVSEMPGVPTIAGVSALVTENALIDYRARTRPCVTQQYPDRIAMDMCGPATLVDEQDIGAIADYYAELSYHAKTQQTDPAKVAIGREIHERDWRNLPCRRRARPEPGYRHPRWTGSRLSAAGARGLRATGTADESPETSDFLAARRRGARSACALLRIAAVTSSAALTASSDGRTISPSRRVSRSPPTPVYLTDVWMRARRSPNVRG